MATTNCEPLRENLRSQSRSIRRSNRENLLVEKRGGLSRFETLDVSPEETKTLALTLRKKGATESHVLVRLQQAFLIGPEQVSAFMSTDGAITALVKALTGLNPTLELKAAYCLCNLALAGGKTTLKISKTAASYLLIHLDGMNSLLQDACAWTIGNVAASGGQSWELVHSQGALHRLLNLLNSPQSDVRVAAIYALTHFVSAGGELLQTEELQSIATSVMPLIDSHEIGRLTFLLSCSSCCDSRLLPDQLLNKVWTLLNSGDLENISILTEITYLLRSVANICVHSVNNAESVIDTLIKSPQIVKVILCCPYPHLKREFLWLLANLFKNENVHFRDLTLKLSVLNSSLI